MSSPTRERLRAGRPIPDEVDLSEDRSDRVETSSTFLTRAADLFSRGVLAGLAAGIPFLLIEMAYFTTIGKPPIAPLLAISTIFHGTDVPTAVPAQIPVDAITGLVLHLGNSMAFGLGFVVLVAALAPLRRANSLVLLFAGAAYGALLYVVNIQILGNYVWEAFTAPGASQLFSFGVHVLFGVLLVPFFLGMNARLRDRAHT